jgi:hypothetical protein
MKRLALLALVAIAAGCGGTRSAPHFEQARGWHAIGEPGQTSSAANVPFAAADRAQSVPSRTIAKLPPSGVVIWVEWVRRGDFRAADRLYPKRPVPLRVEEASYTGTPEGTSSPGAVRQLRVWDSHWDSTVWIFFGRARPLPEDVAAADAELARLALPGAPVSSTTARAGDCARRTGANAYDTSVRPSSGPPGSTAVVTGRLPVADESGQATGQTATEVVAYWNLDLDDWPSVATSAPVAARPGAPVQFIGTENVAGRCTYRARVTIPSAPPGTYPVDVLYGNVQGSASFAPADFRVTSR